MQEAIFDREDGRDGTEKPNVGGRGSNTNQMLMFTA